MSFDIIWPQTPEFIALVFRSGEKAAAEKPPLRQTSWAAPVALQRCRILPMNKSNINMHNCLEDYFIYTVRGTLPFLPCTFL